MKYIVNPQYVLRKEEGKAIIMARQGYNTPAILNVIHPLYAMMLTFFDGREVTEIYKDISSYFSIEIEKVERHLTPLLDNDTVI
ncbi:MAG: hypothetical protein K2J48_08330, partial [Muribaculaceae bacterium]|nr:hypothetical protein [Muribaculaceae bacterium]